MKSLHDAIGEVRGARKRLRRARLAAHEIAGSPDFTSAAYTAARIAESVAAEDFNARWFTRQNMVSALIARDIQRRGIRSLARDIQRRGIR